MAHEISVHECPQCGAEFKKQWPNVNQIACSRNCLLAIYRKKNRDSINKRIREWCRNNRQRRLDIQRKWNNSAKGHASKRKYYDAHLSEQCHKYLARYRADVAFKMVHLSREASRKKLKRSGRRYACEACGFDQRLHCHHKDFNPLNRELENLQWLCIRCHNLVHSEGGLRK